MRKNRELTFKEAMGEVVNGNKVECCLDCSWWTFDHESHDRFDVSVRELWTMMQFMCWRLKSIDTESIG